MNLLRGGACVPTDPHIEGAGGGELSTWCRDTKDRLDRSGDAGGETGEIICVVYFSGLDVS